MHTKMYNNYRALEHVEMKQWEGQWRECGWRFTARRHHPPTYVDPNDPRPIDSFILYIDSQFYISQCCMGQ